MHCSGYDEGERALLSRYWFPVARSVDLVDKPLGVTLLDRSLVLWRAGCSIQAVDDRCCHRGVSFRCGWVEGDELVCAYHGWRFDIQGRCVAVPAHPELRPPASLRLGTHPCLERYGLVWTSLGDPPEDSLPSFPEASDTAFTCLALDPTAFEASAGRQLEGFLDVAHFAWIHHHSFAARDRPEVPDYVVEVLPAGLRFDYCSTVPNTSPDQQLPVPKGFLWSRRFEVMLPFTARLTVTFPSGGRLCLLNASQPIGPRSCRSFTLVARDFDHDLEEEQVLAFNRQIFAEDKAILDKQDPPFLPLDPGAERHVPSDRASVVYRQCLRAMGLKRA